MASLEKLEEKVRSAPLQSVGVAVAAGWLLTQLPVFGILGLVVRVALALLKPALVVFGGVKAWQLIQARCAENPQGSGENR
jgi:hypothetical protein